MRELALPYLTECLRLCWPKTREPHDWLIPWRFPCNPKSKRNAMENFRAHSKHLHRIGDEWAAIIFNYVTSNVCMSMQDKKPTNCTTSKCPWAAAKCSGMSSPILVAFTRAPRERNISTSLRCPSLAHQCSGLNPWSSLPIKTRKKIFNQSTFFSHLNKFYPILSRRKSILLKHLFICDFVIVSIQKKAK